MAKAIGTYAYDPKLTKKENVLLAMKSINEEFGDGTVYSLGSKEEVLELPRWSTGIEDLDNILGGGMPSGRIIEIFGPESAGKTTLAYHLMSRCEMALDIPIEGTFDAKRAKVFGNRKGQLVVSRATFGEEALKTGHTFTKAGGDLVVIDSVPALITKKEFEETDFEKESQRGRIAAMLSKQLPKIAPLAEQMGTTWIFVNQLRDEMGAMMFGPKTHTPGGRALKHYCSLRIQINRVEYIKIANKDPGNSAKDKIVGIIIRCKVVKSKVCNPLGECEIPIFFDRGFVSFSEINSIRKELMQKEREAVKNEYKGAADSTEDD